jgi:hypothetical protein
MEESCWSWGKVREVLMVWIDVDKGLLAVYLLLLMDDCGQPYRLER